MISFSNVFSVTVLIAVVAAVLWWIIRKRLKRVWLPTVKVLTLPRKSLPKMTFILPPIIPFLCFIVSAMCLAAFTLKPEKIVQVESTSKQFNHHIFIDLSPSVTAVTNIDGIKKNLRDFWDKFSSGINLSLSDSRSSTIYEISNQDDLNKYMDQLAFHRAGLRLGQSIRLQYEEISDVDRLYIYSDRDFHSWSDFQWKFLADKIEIYWMKAGERRIEENVFVNGATNIGGNQSEYHEWEVEIARSSLDSQTQSDISGTLSVFRDKKMLKSEKWKILPNENQLKLRLRWEDDYVGNGGQSELSFSVKSERSDAVSLDDTFKVFSIQSEAKVLVIADQSGELQLEDPVHHLLNAMTVLGFETERYDHIGSLPISFETYDAILISGGTGEGVNDFCPTNQVDRFKQKLRENPSLKKAKIWISPISPNANYKEMCHCLSILIGTSEGASSQPSYCSEAATRGNWVELLKSVGGRPVGGEVDMPDASLAWIFKNDASPFEVLAFSLPLNPRLSNGFGFGQFPVVVKSLLEWQSVYNVNDDGAKSWPRIEDISVLDDSSEAELSNVPYGESSLKEVNYSQLPPEWKINVTEDIKTSMMKKQATTPIPWLLAFIFLIGLLTAVEASYTLIKKLLGRGDAVIALMFSLGVFLSSSAAEGQIHLNGIGYDAGPSTSHLSFEINSRTSIQLKKSATNFQSLTTESLKYPWLWARRISSLVASNGSFRRELVNWIKKGGFLVIENITDKTVLEQAIKDHFSHHSFSPKWMPIPPDHEMMRSFYLLDSLPQCNDHPWQGFVFDGRLAILVVPFRFLETLLDNPYVPTCKGTLSREQSVRTFVNILMVALATDYKKDQIHLPEILKRLR